MLDLEGLFPIFLKRTAVMLSPPHPSVSVSYFSGFFVWVASLLVEDWLMSL